MTCLVKLPFHQENHRLNKGPSDCSRATLWTFTGVKDEGVVSSNRPVKDVVIQSKHKQPHVAFMHQLRTQMQNAPLTVEHTLGEENRRVGEYLSGTDVLMGENLKFTHTSEIEHSL